MNALMSLGPYYLKVILVLLTIMVAFHVHVDIMEVRVLLLKRLIASVFLEF